MQRLVGERRALAAAVMAFYGFLYTINAVLAPDAWRAAFTALAATYGLGFFAVVAGYFWARWYALGLSLSGLVVAVVGLFQTGLEPVLLFYGGTHALAAITMFGSAMSLPFDGQTAWRERFHMDELAVQRLGRAVVRGVMSLPFVLLYALAPRDGASLSALAALGLAGAGVWGLVHLRTWGIFALGGAAVVTATGIDTGISHGVNLGLCAVAAAVLLATAVAPFGASMVRFLRSGQR